MRLLHISDLHASSDQSENQRIILARAVEDIAEWHAQTPFDAVVFSGDLANAGSAEELRCGQEWLLDPLAASLGLARSRFFLVPGNHDVQRALVDKFANKGLQVELTDEAAVAGLLDDREGLERAVARLAPWGAFETEFYDGVSRTLAPSLGWSHRLTIDECEVGFICLNSAWRAYGGEEDFQLMLVGERQFAQNLDRLAESAAVRIVVLHHPLDWLARWDQGAARRHLETSVPTIVLTGHQHVPDPTSGAHATGQRHLRPRRVPLRK